MNELKAIIGLGNPGAEYSATRHNIGWMIVDSLSAKFRGVWRTGKGKYFYSPIKIGGRQIYLIRSKTYMNNSGIGLLDAVEKLNILPSEILVVLDDFAIPFGTIRIRKSGSDGGHNGLASIIYHLGTQKISRLRFGIGPIDEHIDAVDFVLSEFTPQEHKVLPRLIAKSVDAIVVAVTQGLDRAMAMYNRKSNEDE